MRNVDCLSKIYIPITVTLLTFMIQVSLRNDFFVMPYLEQNITVDEVSEQLRSLKSGKAPGPE